MKPNTSRLDKLVRHGQQAPLMPLLVPPTPSVAPAASRVSRISVSMSRAEAECIEELAKEVARATGDKPTTSELVRAGLELMAGMTAEKRHTVLAKLSKLR